MGDPEPNVSSVVSKSANVTATGGASPNSRAPPDPNIKLPPIILSGALNDNSGFEWDEAGAPFYKFPPFTTTVAIPFSAFKPYGIQISLDLDEEEVDGNGIRTIQLGVSHIPKDGKKKKKKGQKLDVTFTGRPVMWWEDWEEGEHLRRGDKSDANSPRVDRFIQAAADFQKNRRWTPTLQSVYDNFSQYAGLSGKTNAQTIGKGFASTKKKAQQQIDDEEMNVDDDEAEFAQAVKASNLALGPDESEDARIEEITDYDAELERRELRLQAFLDDPDLRMQIFFSSFYKNKGLFWSESKLRDGPLLMRFFLKFITRNGLMKDHDKAFQKALVVVDRAVIELPLTTRISKAIADEFCNACVGLWGKQMSEIIDKERRKTAEESDNQREMEEEVKEVDKVHDPPSDPVAAITSNDPFNSQNAPNPSSWAPFEIPAQWDTTPAADKDPSSNAENGSNSWDPMSNATIDWALPPPPFLMSLLNGPVSLPLTHEVKVVEKSTRRIVAVELPANDLGSSTKSVFGKFGKVTLVPWVTTLASKPEEVSILPPELYIINPSSSFAEDIDSTKKVIDVYLSPTSVTVLRDAVGMGLYAVFIKVGLREPTASTSKKEESSATVAVAVTTTNPGGPSKKKRKPPKAVSSNQDPDSEFWYIEFLYEVTPSFWTESDEGLDEGSDGED